jgi:hypothetical protein
MLLQKPKLSKARLKGVFTSRLSLSTYFPKGTQFFYGYPVGEDSGFLNHASVSTQEIIAARAFGCAGKDVSIVCFRPTTIPAVPKDVFKELSIPHPGSKQVQVLPAEIGTIANGSNRDIAISTSLLQTIETGQLIMAQPYTDEAVTDLFQIPASVTTWLNDKSNMDTYIDVSLAPKRLGAFRSGKEFAKNFKNVSLPAVIKAASSSSGDGVYICLTAKDLERAARKLKSLKATILAEQYIEAVRNYGVHFGIPHNKFMPIDILGINEQLTTKAGKFVGGIITSTEIPSPLQPAIKHLVEEILPKVRAMGWYGIGGFDILLDEHNKAYFIDCNFRMTGMSAFHFMVANGEIKKPIVSITGEFIGTAADLEKKLYPYASKQSRQKFLQLIAISHHENTWTFNAALSYNDPKQLKERAQLLLEVGVMSHALELLV